MISGFQRTLDHIRSIADSEAQKGRLFERLMKTYFIKDPLYKERFSHVWLWSEWAHLQPGFDGADTGIDLVAKECEGGYCAIQCKCYAPGTRISKPHLDSFISASARDPFTARIVVDTGDRWGRNRSSRPYPCTEARLLRCSVSAISRADRSIGPIWYATNLKRFPIGPSRSV